MSNMCLRLLIVFAALAGALAGELEATRIGRKLSSLCHRDRCGIWCGPPRTGACAIDGKPTCPPPTKVDCYPPNYSDPQCSRYCGPDSSRQNENQCGGYTYICHAPPPVCYPPTKVDCYPPNYSDPLCSLYCGPTPQKQPQAQCGGFEYTCHAPPPYTPPCPPPEEVSCPYNSQKWGCKKYCGPNPEPQPSNHCGGKIFLCQGAPAPPSPPEQQEVGCLAGDGLPFGLENCVCDGAEVGIPAGDAACGRVANECANQVLPFSAEGLLGSVQKVCDNLALDACVSAAQNAFSINPGCREILDKGTPTCTPAQAQQIWVDTVNKSCEPICPTCARLP